LAARKAAYVPLLVEPDLLTSEIAALRKRAKETSAWYWENVGRRGWIVRASEAILSAGQPAPKSRALLERWCTIKPKD
jgi:hypothetical protein